jgi:hypothetical protein
MTIFSAAQAAWRKQVREIASTTYYTCERTARAFLVGQVLPAWATLLNERDPGELQRRLRVTTTQALILHMFGRGVLGVDVEGRVAPRFTTWPPSRQYDAKGDVVCYRVVPKGDIATIIGRSRHSVDEALRRFKGRSRDEITLPERGLCNVISTEAGVALDGIFSAQTSFPFMYAVTEYANAKLYAFSSRVAHGQFVERQQGWCERALKAHQMPALIAEAANDIVSSNAEAV